MHLGLLTAPFEDTPLMEVADWAGANGFSAFEVACWPASGGEKRRYAGTSHIDVDGLTKAQGQEIIGGLAERGIRFPASATTPIRSTPTRPTATRSSATSRRSSPAPGPWGKGREHLRRRRPDAQRR
jgi:sugar phosphate isomerase/epimerase